MLSQRHKMSPIQILLPSLVPPRRPGGNLGPHVGGLPVLRVADVLRALVHPASDGDVMARVESLVEREYLESSSPGVFNYIP